MRMASLLLIVIVEILVCRKTIGADVFASTSQLRMLDETEVDLITALKFYIDTDRQKLGELHRLVAEVEEERRATETDSPLVSGTDHPVYVFRLIHRFTTTWKRYILPLITNDDSPALQDVRGKVDSLREIMPTDDDYEGVKSALIRLQRAYKLNVADIINGTILGQTTQPMTQQMAIDVAVSALDRTLVDDAFLWLALAQNHPVPPLTPLQDIYHTISRIYKQKGQLVEAAYFAKKALEIDPSNEIYLSDILPKEDSRTLEYDSRVTNEKQQSLCIRYLVQDNSPIDSTLSCFYERGRHTPMLRTKVEMLHQSPDVVLIHDLITDNEAAELRRMAMSKFQRALVGAKLIGKVSESRVGKIAWLPDDMGEQLVDRISKRISETTGLETKKPFGEAFQVSNYGLGGHYSMHYDYDKHRHDTVPTELMKKAGDRIATFVIYLNNAEAGGATVFPNLKIGTRPVKNAALFWYNYKRSGSWETLSLHAGCPVLIGEKWVAVKWIRELGQLFRRPCDLSSDI